MKKLLVISLAAITVLSACESPSNRKVLIMGRGGITANGNDISMKDGSGYTEETIDVNGDKAVSWNVQTPSGKTTVNIPEGKGFYILNLKTDTIVGSQQMLGTDISSSRMITQEELKLKIDSLGKLTTGSNVSSKNHNYIVFPNKLTKVSDNIEARVYGPFNKVPSSIDADKNGKAPEIYKFYTNTEIRDLITTFKKLTKSV